MKSKGLEALENIKGNCDLFDEGYQWDNEFSKQFDNDLDVIEKELKEKETQDDYIEVLEDRISNLETTYLRYKKALEIIKEKANIVLLEDLDDDEPHWLDIGCSTKLTQKEYDFLKEVLYETKDR